MSRPRESKYDKKNKNKKQKNNPKTALRCVCASDEGRSVCVYLFVDDVWHEGILAV